MKIKKGNEKQKQQGDVILMEIDAVPTGAIKIEPVNGCYVIAQGSAGGNSHIINATSGVTLYKYGEGFVVEGPATMIHTATSDKHDDLAFNKIWLIDFIVESDPFSKLISIVKD